jgi:hypothetical protein
MSRLKSLHILCFRGSEVRSGALRCVRNAHFATRFATRFTSGAALAIAADCPVSNARQPLSARRPPKRERECHG